ncbi:MAG: TonB-dependent receptor [Proteobacteria bacterium]|nr:TonB-dependent receptor [Pseudomonadota bacterium]
MFICRLMLLISFLLFSFTYVLGKEKETELEEVIVIGDKIVIPTKQTGETVYTGTEITSKGIEIVGDKAKQNIYETITILPGIVYESIDPNNMASEQTNLRIRGVRGYLGALTVEGIPNYGGNPIGPRAYIYDLENFESVAIYKGAVPADLGSGIGNRAGALELRPLWAKENFGIKFSQSLGNFDYKKTYARLDTGAIYHLNTKFSLSYSFSEQDKWKGPGEISPRNNLNFTLVQPIGEKIEIKLWSNFNEVEHYKYRFLTYKLVENLSTFYRLDFNSSLLGVPAKDYLYYKYNWETHRNKDMYIAFSAKLADKLKLVLKPYLSLEDAKLRDGTQNIQGRPGVLDRTRDIERKGLIGELTFDSENIKLIGGYHYEISNMNIYTENYWLNPDGSLRYRGYGVTATSGDAFIKSPYLKVAGTIYKLNWQAGLKYFRFEDSDSQGYITRFISGIPVLQRAIDLDREKVTYDIWLPTAGLSYSFNDNVESYISYGKTFIRPYAYLPLVTLYNRLRTRFLSAGITLKDLFKDRDIEESNNLDIGLRIRTNYFEFNPTLFFSKNKNLLTVITDPRVIDPLTGKPVNYQQNIGKADGYGFEFGANIYFTDKFIFYLNPAYTNLTYDGNITYSGQMLKTDGRQVVDVPKWVITSGFIAKIKGFEVIPKMRYIGKRYGDVEHKERIPSYTVFDLSIGYTMENLGKIKTLKLSLDFDNIFDKKYVSLINAMDDAVAGTTYGVGAPFSFKANLSFNF